MQNPWTSTIELTAIGGELNNFEIRVPHRGTIVNFVAVQESGNLDGYVIRLFDSRRAAPPNTGDSSASSADSGIASTNYQIFPPKTAGNGAREIVDSAANYAYINRDGTPCNPVRRLYLQIQPAGSGPKDFSVTLRIATPLLR